MIKIKGGITTPKHFKAAALNCGIKKKRKDLSLIFSTVPAMACGVFTQNRVKAAPVLVCKEHLKGTIGQAIVANSGNANCCTGDKGLKDANIMTELVARELGLHKEDVLVASTGVIGKELPIKKIKEAIPELVKRLKSSNGHDVAEAIMTTDKITKELAVKVRIKGKDVTIGATCKGAGMICPNMATMLCFITTDAYITRRALKIALTNAIEKSFNAISVDGDMSTNDSVIALANGSAGNELLDKRDKDFSVFSDAIEFITSSLAKLIVKDGEGATKIASINIVNAKTQKGAKKMAKSVATSALFKTALFGEDPNWGRIAASIGSSGIVFDPDKLDIYIGDAKVLKAGTGLSKNLSSAKRYFKKNEVEITIDLNSGNKDYTMWTCDLTSDYVKINAHYST